MSTARPMALTVLSPSGEVLGVWTTTPSNPNRRMTREPPHVQVGSAPVRDCEPHGEGWAVRLKDGEKAPRKMVRL